MKRRIFFAALLVVAAAFAGRYFSRTGGDGAGGRAPINTRESYKLEPGASVEVRGINGPVEVTTSETDTAVLQVLRTGGSPDGPVQQEVVVDYSPSSLVVRGEGGSDGFWRWVHGGGREQLEVRLALPRKVAFTAKGINGPLEVGEIDGSVEVLSTNGNVSVEQALGRSELRGVNGNVHVGVARLGEQGMEVKGVNGNVEVRLGAGLDADIHVRGQNGNVSFDVPNASKQEREGSSEVRARVGDGGAPITVRGGNGNLTFKSDVTVGRITFAPGAAEGDGDMPPPPPPPPAPIN
ncbi:MAG TPA: hypothetical protein VD968_13990 [Pyrinomonadaceae bacterium]|nr:hypothetical protein [Pyrinomonadaceae bacterium]